jgi:hypothetical protein
MMRGANVAGGFATTITNIWTLLRTYTSNSSFERTVAGAIGETEWQSLKGTWDATLAPTTYVDVSSKNNSSALYDFAAAGVMATIYAANNAAALATLLGVLATTRATSLEDADARQHSMGRLGFSGLSYQPITDMTGLGLAATPTTIDRIDSVTRAAQTGMLFRYR